MNRENVYFSHDANAMNDPKCMMLITQLGMEGYGIFWGLVEFLRQQNGYRLPLSMIGSIAARFMVSQQKVETVIRGYGLFVIENDEFFYSQSLRDRMEIMDKRKASAKLAIETRWNRVRALAQQNSSENDSNTNVLRNEYDSNTKKRKEKKGKLKEKESREKENDTTSSSQSRRFVAPTLQEVENYIVEKGYHVNAARFVSYYESIGWMVGKNKMKSWKQAVVTWELKDNPKKAVEHEPESESIYDNCLQ